MQNIFSLRFMTLTSCYSSILIACFSFGISLTKRKPLHLLSFDLDDTLWCTDRILFEANQKIEHLHGIKTNDVINKMKDIRKSSKVNLTYTYMRTEAYRALGLEDPVKAFKTWLDSRDLAARKYLFADVISSVSDLKKSGWLICAITNGRGSVLRLGEPLSSFFIFEISGDDNDVFPFKKPDPQRFHKAIDRMKLESEWDGNLSNIVKCQIFKWQNVLVNLWQLILIALSISITLQH
jgi:FMN phosphatase YigB (HAD superfamily)